VTIGLDASEAFLETARHRVPEATFRPADLTEVPLPAASLAYARYLLAHLPAPESLVARWTGDLAPGGVLLVEENLAMEAAHPTFARYRDAVAGVMGGDLFAGRRLLPLADRATTRLVAPPAGTIARLFAMNLQVWGDRAEGIDVDGLRADLQALAGSDERGLLTWRLAQLAFDAARTA